MASVTKTDGNGKKVSNFQRLPYNLSDTAFIVTSGCLRWGMFGEGIHQLVVLLYSKVTAETSLVVQWLRICALNAGVWGSIPDQGTRFGAAN